jgi:hypothetical protein
MVDKLEISHVERPELPWRKPEQMLTECGLVVASYPTITRDELFHRWKEWGEQRTAMTVCMTCFQTAQRWQTWFEDPLHGVQRAIEKEPRHYGGIGWKYGINQPAPNSPLRAELRAMAMLIERHREEFDGILTGLGEVVNLDEKRRERAEKKRQERAQRRPDKW